MMPASVEARGLIRTYATARGPIHAVGGIDLEVAPGEFLAVCGRSGSGKSTLLAMLGGLCRPTAGTVRVGGVDLGSMAPGPLAEFRARRLGFLFQFSGLLPGLRAVDNVALPALLGGLGQAQAYERARELLEQVGLAERWDARAAELSGGQRRRVALARALINRPDLLLADEPTGDLDEQAEREVLGLLRELQRAHGTTLVVVTHDRNLARSADRVIQLRGGTIASTARPEPRPDPPLQTVEPAPAFEPGPATLAPAEPTPPGAGLGRFLIGFVGWMLAFACALYAADLAAARVQRRTIEGDLARRKQAEELALQQLRADVGDVTARPDGRFELGLYLENFDPARPFYVLGPKPRLFVQVDQSWRPIPVEPAAGAGAADAVHAVTARQVFPFTFRADLDRFDELIRGYMHVRISNVMVVSASPEPAGDLFERNDDYYIYLKPPGISDDEVRRRNGWQPGALVPRWIAMPAH